MRFVAVAAISTGISVVCALIAPVNVRHGSGGKKYPPLLEADLEDLAFGLEHGWFSSVDLVKAYTARILEINGTLHAVTELNPDALTIAATLDDMRADGQVLSPLHGVPILLKDNVATNDKMNNTSGSFALLGAKVPRDSTVAAKLRDAGAVLLGKAALSQWARYRSDNTSNGWSAYGGQVFAAYYPGQDPIGSSSGSGVAGSLALSLATIGTETAGSIISPAEANNVVGIKPTVGLTSRYLVVPISEHQDTVGPMARSVKDAAYILQAIAGVDPRDNYTSAIPHNGRVPDYVAACDYGALNGTRIGVPWNVIGTYRAYTNAPVLKAFDEAIEQIKKAGATVVDANYTAFEQWKEEKTQLQVLNADFVVNLPQYLSELTHNPNNVTDLHDVLRFTQEFPAEDWPRRDTLVWEGAFNQSWNNTDPQFWEAYQKNLFYGGEGGLLGALERTNTDAIILPSSLSPTIPALVGSPVVTVPMGFYPADWPVTMNGFGDLVDTAPNVPFGLSFMGRKWSEADLIGFAYAYEQRTHHRHDVEPYIAPNIELADVIDSDTLYHTGAQAQCSKEWVERCEMVEEWPSFMRRLGAPTKKHWWSDMWERSPNETDASSNVKPAI